MGRIKQIECRGRAADAERSPDDKRMHDSLSERRCQEMEKMRHILQVLMLDQTEHEGRMMERFSVGFRLYVCSRYLLLFAWIHTLSYYCTGNMELFFFFFLISSVL